MRNFYAGAPSAGDMLSFLQSNSTATDYNGDILDGLRPVNDDLFTLCIKKRVVLMNNNVSAITTTLAQTAMINPCRTFSFNLTKFIRKTLIFDDNFNSATNSNLYIAIGATQCDGSLPLVNQGSYTWITDFTYEDA